MGVYKMSEERLTQIETALANLTDTVRSLSEQETIQDRQAAPTQAQLSQQISAMQSQLISLQREIAHMAVLIEANNRPMSFKLNFKEKLFLGLLVILIFL
jgi:phage-related tail protein